MLCVLDYDDYSFINSCELEIPQNGGEHLVVKTIYSEDSDETETRQMLLDQDYHVISEPLRKNAISNEQIQHSNRKLLRGCGASAAYDAGWSNSHNTEGSGLGLAITPPQKKKKIIEAHGGTVTLLDKPSPGFSTEFEILLPAVM